MKKTPLRVACISAVIGIFAGCSYVVSADRAKIPDDLFQPSVLPEAEADAATEDEAAEEAGDESDAQSTDEGDAASVDESTTGEADMPDSSDAGVDASD